MVFYLHTITPFVHHRPNRAGSNVSILHNRKLARNYNYSYLTPKLVGFGLLCFCIQKRSVYISTFVHGLPSWCVELYQSALLFTFFVVVEIFFDLASY